MNGILHALSIFTQAYIVLSARSDWSRHDEDVDGMDEIAGTPI